MLKLDWSLLWTAINLVIWYILIKKFLFKPVNNIIAKRKEANDAEKREADEAKKEAFDLKEKYDKALANATADGEAIRQKSRDEAKAEYDRIVAEAKAKADATLAEAHAKIEEDQKKMIHDTENKVADLVMEATKKMMTEKSDKGSDWSIYNDFLAEEEKKIESGEN
ncbi:MAG: ATP synthase F0 subunit B [Catonella sp.]|jgi:F-type H+-transporting ATPase subunit b|nr:ATP synthase F0 subunit B [Catonella sp.]MDY6356410.1 ATP synthase F0 subunit B [Catonella sp.]